MLTTLAAADLPRPPPTARPAALLPGWMGGGDAIGPAECMRGGCVPVPVRRRAEALWGPWVAGSTAFRMYVDTIVTPGPRLTALG